MTMRLSTCFSVGCQVDGRSPGEVGDDIIASCVIESRTLMSESASNLIIHSPRLRRTSSRQRAATDIQFTCEQVTSQYDPLYVIFLCQTHSYLREGFLSHHESHTLCQHFSPYLLLLVNLWSAPLRVRRR